MLIRFNRPERLNTLGGTLLAELNAALDAGNADDSIRAFVVTGEGRGWCAGADLGPVNAAGSAPRAVPANPRVAAVDLVGEVGRTILNIYNSDKPVIAAVNGVAAGGGFGFCSSMDIRIASDRARFGTAFIKIALAPDCGLSWFLPQLVGPERAAELFYTGRIVEADEALALGIVSKVVPHETLMEETMAFAQELAKKPPSALTLTRRAIQRSRVFTLEQQLEYEWTNQRTCLASGEFREGVAAFMEKRAPNFA
jgi:2-(1,2-epoxy-1,2-dihydrophenyl)acetyl-CoA isomerase